MWRATTRFLARIPPPAMLLLALSLVALIGWVDYVTNIYLSLGPFYTVPVAMTAWYGSLARAVVVSCMCTLVSLAGDLAARPDRVSLLHPYINTLVRLGLFLLVAVMFVRLKDALESAVRLAGTDPLTGVANARSFESAAERELERVRRYGHPLALVYIDLDDFKRVNDEQGHSIGDQVLREVAETIVANVRPIDLVARVGGDEFAVLLPETSTEAAAATFERLRGTILARMRAAAWPVTLSVGVAGATHHTSSVDELVAEADRLMYRAKTAGKDRIAAARPDAD